MSWTYRRFLFASLVIATVGFFSMWLASILAVGLFGFLAVIMIIVFDLKFTWVAINFWNAIIGFAISRYRRVTLEGSALPKKDCAIEERIAIAMTVCDEDAVHVVARLRSVRASLDASGYGSAFDYFLLSDSSNPNIISLEERLVQVWREEMADHQRLTYRRRAQKSGLQHGNLYEFASRFGKSYEVMVVLDADSLMTAGAILMLVRTMLANPRIGMLQSLNSGILMETLFARIFEFGHRHSMRCWLAGAVWWQGERGQYRGHNAAIRVDAYTNYCNLATLPGKEPFGGVMFCHDQIESLLMHRAGYEIREIPMECGSYEGVPPALTDFTTRYNRWFQGNLKNLRMLRLPSLTAMDRYHLIGVAHRFISWPAVVLFVALAAFLTLTWPAGSAFPAHSALLLYASYFLIYFTPKILGLLDSAMSAPDQYAGIIRLIAGGLLDFAFTILFLPTAMVTATFRAIGFFSGQKLAWDTQRRERYCVSWAAALASLWPQTVIGVALLAALAFEAPLSIPWFLPFLTGLALAIPIAVITTSTKLNDLAIRWKLCALPEEIGMPAEIMSLLEFEAQMAS